MTFPTPREVLDLAPEELAPALLDLIKAEAKGHHSTRVHFGNFTRRYDTPAYGDQQLDTKALTRRLSEAWSVLERAGLIAVDPTEMNLQNYFVTRKGHAAQSADEVQDAVVALSMPSECLHPLLQSTVYSKFVRRDYENAILEAFKLVEVTARAAGKLPAALIGTQLMRDLFNPTTGPLTDMTEVAGERQGLSDLFAGALARFKNPSSHRLVAYDATSCRELLHFASFLLRVVDARKLP
jgi:uncharacterized protein (TIGR02391 family)